MNKFDLGQIVATPAALEAIEDAGQTPAFFLNRHRKVIGARSPRAMPPSTIRPSSAANDSSRPTAH